MMFSTKAILMSLLCFLSSIPAVAVSRERTQIITVNDCTYEIEVGGFRDPVNETIIIENLGDKPLVNPRITVNGLYDWFDVESIAREATRGCSTDEERAFAIFNFVRTKTQHMSPPGDRECLDPVVFFNVYGYANCAYHACASVGLARALGMKARVWEVSHHTISDVWYNNAWHMLDSDIGLYFLMDDNRTIASVEQLWADQKVTDGKPDKAYLTKYSGRAKAIPSIYTDVEGKNAYVDQDGKKQRGYRFFFDDDFCYVQEHYTYEPHTMAMTIRANEKLIRNFKSGPVYYDYRRHNAQYARDPKPWRKPIRWGDGQIIWKPDLTSDEARSYLSRELYTMFSCEDGLEPAIHVKHKQGDIYKFTSFASFPVDTPYVIIGGRLKAKVYRGAATDWDNIKILVRSHAHGQTIQKLWEAPNNLTGTIDVDVDLDEALYPTGRNSRKHYTVQFDFTANVHNDPPTQSGVESVEMITDIQCATNSLPALSLGKNVIRYRDETPGPHKVKITHIWRERTDNHPPLQPRDAVYPKDGSVVDDLAPLFKWKAAEDLDDSDSIDNYCITISFDPQCRWPISTSLLAETESSKPQWQLADGWLNKDTTYYWQVKARDNRDIWGKNSPVFRFKTAK